MSDPAFQFLEYAEFAVRTREEGAELVEVLSPLLADAILVGMCLTELVVNAVEHGNLEIGGALKCQLLRAGTYAEELAARYRAYAGRRVHVSVRRLDRLLEISIADEGAGFPWRTYVADGAPACATNPNGRGIALVKTRFPDLQYTDSGSRVVVRSELRS